MSVDVEQLSCQELVELVTDYLEGALSAEDTARFEEHIGRCSGCAAYLEQIRQTIALTGRLTAESLSPEAERELLDAFRGWRGGDGGPRENPLSCLGTGLESGLCPPRAAWRSSSRSSPVSCSSGKIVSDPGHADGPAPRRWLPSRGTVRTDADGRDHAAAPVVQAASVRIAATRGDCWVVAHAGSANGPVLLERVVRSGEQVTVRARRVWLELGAAGTSTSR